MVNLEIEKIPSDKLRDRVSIKHGGESASRDGIRTPMQWDDSIRAGFSFGKDAEPWLPVNDNYKEVNVSTELADKDSILNFYRALIAIRKNHRVLQEGSWRTLINYPYEHLAYVRELDTDQVLVAINFSYEKAFKTDEDLEPEAWQVLLSTDYESGEVMSLPKTLKPFETSIYLKR